MTESASLPKPAMILIALIQGLLLLFLHEAIDAKVWPYGYPQWLVPFYSVALAVPTMLLLGINQTGWRRLCVWVAPYGGLLFLLAFYVGSQMQPYGKVGGDSIIALFWLTALIATFKVLMYAQQFASGERVSYHLLFLFSWRNFLTLSLALLFMLVFWGILVLWGALFKVIDIHFFDDLFEERWFLYPALSMAVGFGVIIFRNLTHVIDTITRLQQALMKYLLPVLLVIMVLFLLALLVTGLTPLWRTGKGTALVLWLQALVLFFLNGVYQDKPQERPYGLRLHRMIYCAVALLPAYSAIALYGLWVRIAQYGWTVDRGLAMLAWLVFAVFALGYLWAIIRRRDEWVFGLSGMNIRAGWLVLALMLLINSPLLDLRKLSVASQMARLKSSDQPAEFDFRYFERYLGKPGYEALMAYRAAIADERPDVVKAIDRYYADTTETKQKPTREQFAGVLDVYPAGVVVPDALMRRFYEESTRNWRWRYGEVFTAIKVDANADGQSDYLLVERLSDDKARAMLFHQAGGAWQTRGVVIHGVFDQQGWRDALTSTGPKTVAPTWYDVQIGELLLKVRE